MNKYVPKHEVNQCPRCTTEFECKTGSVLQCQCQLLTINAQQLGYIVSKYDDCLCVNCLRELRSEFNKQEHKRAIEEITG